MKRDLLLFLFFAYAACPPATPKPTPPDDVLVFVVELEPARCTP